jgi:type VI secretion system protein ImpJ
MKLQPVIWAKGTFLTPQHFQAQERFIADQLHFQIEALNFRPWGFTRLTVDHRRLATGDVALLAATGILPDGLLFDIPDSDRAPEPRSILQYFSSTDDTLDIYLGIPHYVDRGLNVASPGHPAAVRYSADVAMFNDENTGNGEKPIQIARKKFRIFIGEENREGHTAIKIARVRRTASGTIQADPDFVPPLLDLHASDRLTSLTRKLVEILAARSANLSSMRRQRNQSLAEFTVQDIGSFWLLYTINSHIPVFRHLLESKRGHPEKLFTEMLSLAGALTTFSTKIQPQDLPFYDHDNLDKCFSELDHKLSVLLQTVVPSNFVSLAMKLSRPSIYAAAIEDEKYLANTRMYLAVSSKVNEAELINRAPHLIKVCSASYIERLVAQALPGVRLTHVAAPPNPIPVKLHYQYFSLEQTGPAWEAIANARNVAAYVPVEFPDPQLELIILLPQAG